MPSTTLQTVYRDWSRRAEQFAHANIPTSSWQQLYQRDVQGVYQGGQPMSDAEIYAGVQSAVRGPQIGDPAPQHGGHGILSVITDTIGNIPSDIKGIITGFPAGIAHTAAHFPSELSNTGKLIENLASGNSTWLQQNGYLNKGESLHSGWSGFGQILRAMNENGSKQLLPFIPGLSDLANMTSKQGRNVLLQHPVGSMLDVLPEAGWLGKLSVAGRDFSVAARGAELGSREPRFWAAGRALQKGNPVKAVVSALGDIIPGGFDDATMAKVTARERINMAAEATGFSRAIRENIVRPYMNMVDELKSQVRAFKHEMFGSGIWNQLSPERAYYLYMGFHALVNPDTGKSFATMDEFNKWRDTLPAEENAAFTHATDLGEKIRRSAVNSGYAGRVPYPKQLEAGPWDGMGGMTVSTKSRAWKSWEAVQRKQDKLDLATDAKYDQSLSVEQRLKAHRDETKYHKELQAAKENLARIQATELPGEWNAAIVAHIRSGARENLSKYMHGQTLEDTLKTMDKSVYEQDMRRVLGDEVYDGLKSDAIAWWHDMGDQGMAPIYFHDVDPNNMDRILSPRANVEKISTPPMFNRREAGVYFGDSVFDVRVGLTRGQMEMTRAAFVTKFINDHIIPRAHNKAQRLKEYQEALDQARKDGNPIPKTAQQLVKENYKDFAPQDFGVRPVKFKNVEGKELLIDNDTHRVLKQLSNPWEMKGQNMGSKTLLRGHSIYKFAVLTGPRHLAHVGFGGMAFMMGADPQAVLKLGAAVRQMREVNRGKTGGLPGIEGLSGRTMSGLKEDYYAIGARNTWDYKGGIAPHYGWSHHTGAAMGEGYLTELIHQAAQKGLPVLEYVPNKLSQLETNIMTMYKTAVYLSRKSRGYDHKTALEQAHKLFVDMNGMSTMERTVVKQIFPFYAFTRHLFRYLANYPVDYPLRAAIVTNFAEQEQKDWKSGLPRSYMSLYFLGHTNSKGDIHAFDLKNVNPFRSFANDFTLAGFTSSLTPFVTAPLAAMGVDTLSGTTQLYPGTTYNPQTGTLQATPNPGWQFSVAEAFVPQIGLLDHYMKLTRSTQLLAKYNPNAYQKQLYNLVNVPFTPQVVNVPYEKEITEMRRFRAAQSAVSLVEKDPSSANISKLLEWNVVPFDNQLILPQAIATYYSRVRKALEAAGQGQISPKAVTKRPPARKAQLQNF